MMVIVANDTPDAVRGLLKRWFVEPRPNVFVGSVNRRTRDKVVEYIRRHGQSLGMLIIASDNSSQGFSIESYGETHRRPVQECGLYLVAEEWDSEEQGEWAAEQPSGAAPTNPGG
ncbi:MAG: type I-E CRISPR-associated endoribonuclease Cas2e [Candidatus Latescibacterota bacterium]